MDRPLAAYLLIVTILSAGFILGMVLLGGRGYYLAQPYMLIPAVAAIITRCFFSKDKFRDAHLGFGRAADYAIFWLLALGTTAASYAACTLLGAIRWDLTGQTFLYDLEKQFAMAGQSMSSGLPAGWTPRLMLWLFFVGGLTLFNVFPGLINGFGEEFGWRGFMFPRLYRIKPWVAFVAGGLIWYAWHLPLALVFPQPASLGAWTMAMNLVLLALGSLFTFAFLAYVYIKTENIWVASLAHITLNNAARSISYFAIVENQLRANAGLVATMGLVIAILYFAGELRIFERYFARREGT